MNCKFGNIGLLSKVTISLSLTWMLMGGKSRKCWKVREIHELICFFARYLSMEYGCLYSYEVDFLFFYRYTTNVNRFYYQLTLSQ